MKTVKITFILIVLSFTVFSVLNAQEDRLKQDIRIGESILIQMINDSRDQLPIRGLTARTVNGEYIPGYGVHFTIGSGIAGISSRADREIVTPEEAGERLEMIMRDYLQNYAVLIRNLREDENVRLTFGLQNQAGRITLFRTGGPEQRMEIPKLSVWVTVSDLMSYRSGELSEDQLRQKIHTDDLSDEKAGNDLKIFASVLKTAIDNAEIEHLRVRREPGFDYIPGMGVHYHLNTDAGGIFGLANVRELNAVFNPDAEFRMNNAQNALLSIDSIRIHMHDVNDSLLVGLDQIRKQAEEARLQAAEAGRQAEVIRELAEKAKERGEQIGLRAELRFAQSDTVDYSEDMEKVVNQLRSVLSDYGQTLQTLSDGEYVMITVNWRGRNLPDKTTIRIRKNDLLTGQEPVVTQFD